MNKPLHYWINLLQETFTGLSESVTGMIERQVKYEKGVAEAYTMALGVQSGHISISRLINHLEALTKND